MQENFTCPSENIQSSSEIDPSRFVRSVFVDAPPKAFQPSQQRVPPDKSALLEKYRMHIRRMEITRQSHVALPPNPMIWDTEEFSWTKADNNSWAIPNSVQDLDEDPLHSYDASATLNNVVLNICRAPDQLQLNQLHDKDFVIKIENTAQSDSGANANITPHLQLLRDVRWFDPVSIGNAQKDSTLTVTAIGKFPLQTDQGIILINMYYSPNATNTIISPTAICSQVDHTDGFHQWSNIRSKKGYLEFIRSDSIDEANFRVMLVEDNGLWYHSEAGYVSSTSDSSLQVNALSDAAKYELWHQRLGHCGAWALENAHKHCIGVPKLRGNSFYKCPSCMAGKLCTKRSNYKRNRNLGTIINHSSSTVQAATDLDTAIDLRDTTIVDNPTQDDYLDELHLPDANPGQHFHLDFGFVRGSEYEFVTDEGKRLTSIDGKNAYLLLVDRKTRYMWIYLTHSKEPPLNAIEMVLSKFGSNDKHRTVRTDQDKGLSKSKDYLDLLEKLKFTPEMTGTDNSQQNSRAERPHRDLSQMMRCLLHSSGLGPEYWTYALRMAVYIKNRLPHKSLQLTPFQSFTGKKPDLSRLRIFGSRVRARRPGRRPAKLDSHSDSGIFLSFGATDANVYFIDDASGTVKLGTHVIFDEAHMSVPARRAPLAAEALQRLGYYNREQWIDSSIQTEVEADMASHIRMTPLTATAQIPQRATPDSIGYDVYSDAENTHIQPGKIAVISTGIAATPPPGTYLRVAPRSGLTVKNHLTTLAGVIDPDYTGNIGVVLYNFGEVPQIIKKGDKIAQLVLEQARKANIVQTDVIPTTERSTKGFGSSDSLPKQRFPNPMQDQHSTNPVTPNLVAELSSTSAAAAASVSMMNNICTDLNLSLDLPYDIALTSNPFDTYSSRVINVTGQDDLLGLRLTNCPNYSLPKLMRCEKSTPAARLQRWRSELKGGYIRSVNDTPTTTVDDVKKEIARSRARGDTSLTIHFALIDRIAFNSQTGLPHMFYDQLNVIGRHLFDIKHDPALVENNASILGKDELQPSDLPQNDFEILKDLQSLIAHSIDSSVISKRRGKLTRRKLLQCSDWDDWRESEVKQLDQYESQQTFGPPQDLPPGANVLNLIWTYLIKDDGRKKARCVCNGSKNMRGTVTLAETYAASLEQTGSRIFWAATALNNFVSIGADAANAFAEAPAPVAPLYVRIDEPYRAWYQAKYPHRSPIPPGSVMRVQKALQGHPESPRLWATLIDKVIKHLNLQPCTHEPNLYFASDYNQTGKKVLLLRQVDDFAISCEDKNTALEIIESINKSLTINVKELGMISRFNGVDILQSRNFIKLSNETYIDKVLENHQKWLKNATPLPSIRPIPMRDNTEYIREIENSSPLDSTEKDLLEEDIGFTYRQAIGELIYAMVTCRPDISYAVIKLSQYSVRPARIHYQAVQQVIKYLACTKTRGIYYWRNSPNYSLKLHPSPSTITEPSYDESSVLERKQHDPSLLVGAVDSDYAGDTSHRKSVTGICLRIAGGTVLYKTHFQPTIALSTTEAEFTAACEAGKYILYLRTILSEIGLDQNDATILYEDNQGALLMANAQRPTRRTRHMDVKYFALQHWIENDLLNMKRIHTSDNYADALTKASGKILFYRHMDFIMGYVIPHWSSAT